jgi:hypothetical protein
MSIEILEIILDHLKNHREIIVELQTTIKILTEKIAELQIASVSNTTNASASASASIEDTTSTTSNEEFVEIIPTEEELENEIWRSLTSVGYENAEGYSVSNLGKIRKNNKEIACTFRKDTKKTVIPINKKRIQVEEIVANAFLPISNFKYIKHMNDIKHDNRASNLVWSLKR